MFIISFTINYLLLNQSWLYTVKNKNIWYFKKIILVESNMSIKDGGSFQLRSRKFSILCSLWVLSIVIFAHTIFIKFFGVFREYNYFDLPEWRIDHHKVLGISHTKVQTGSQKHSLHPSTQRDRYSKAHI